MIQDNNIERLVLAQAISDAASAIANAYKGRLPVENLICDFLHIFAYNKELIFLSHLSEELQKQIQKTFCCVHQESAYIDFIF